MILKIAAVQNCNDTSTLFCCTALHWILLCLYFCWTSRLASGWSWRNPVAVLSSGLAVVQLFTLTNKTLKGTLDIRLSPLCWSLKNIWAWCRLLRCLHTVGVAEDSGSGGRGQVYLHTDVLILFFWCPVRAIRSRWEMHWCGITVYLGLEHCCFKQHRSPVSKLKT